MQVCAVFFDIKPLLNMSVKLEAELMYRADFGVAIIQSGMHALVVFLLAGCIFHILPAVAFFIAG